MNLKEFVFDSLEKSDDKFIGTQVKDILFDYIPARFLETPYVPYQDIEKMNEAKKDGIFFYGGVGTGKSTRMFQVMIERAMTGKLKSRDQLWCGDVIALVSDYKFASYEDKKRVMDYYCNVSEMYVDDLGVEVPDEQTGMYLYAITERRWGNKRPTFFTSNNPIGEWAKAYSGIGARIASRIVDITKMVEVVGEDFRLRNRA